MISLRNGKGLKQWEVASAIGVTPATISAYETGNKLPSVELALNLADFYQIPLDDLLCTGYKQGQKMETYGDIARALILIDKETGGFDLSVYEKPRPEYPSSKFSITFFNEKLKEFLVKDKNNREAMRDFQGGQEMYEAWLEKYLAQLDDISIDDSDRYPPPDVEE